MRCLQPNTVTSLINGQVADQTWKIHLIDQQRMVSLQVAHHSKKLFQTKKAIGEQLLDKMVCAILVAFTDSLKIKEKPDGAEIYEMAVIWIDKASHESLNDLILCLKMVKEGQLGKMYARWDVQVFMEYWQGYIEWKALELEKQHLALKSEKNGGVNNLLHKPSQVAERAQKEAEAKLILEVAKINLERSKI